MLGRGPGPPPWASRSLHKKQPPCSNFAASLPFVTGPGPSLAVASNSLDPRHGHGLRCREVDGSGNLLQPAAEVIVAREQVEKLTASSWAPRRNHLNGQARGEAARAVTRAINACLSIRDLQALLAQHPVSTFNHIHATALATAFVRVLQPADEQGAGDAWAGRHSGAGPAFATYLQILTVVQHHVEQLDARGIANVLWAVARSASDLGLSTGGDATDLESGLDATRDAANHKLDAGVNTLSEQHQQTREVAQQLATGLLQIAGQMQWQGFSPQHLSNSLWAAATLQLQVSPAQVHIYFSSVQELLQHFNSQALINMIWASARLGLAVPSSVLAHLYSLPPAQLLDGLALHGVSSLLWSLATLCGEPSAAATSSQGDAQGPSLGSSSSGQPTLAPPAPWLHALLTATQPHLKVFSPQSLANTAWALQRLGVKPARGWSQALAAAAYTALPHMEPQQLSGLLWGLASMPHMPHTSLVSQEQPSPVDTASRADMAAGSTTSRVSNKSATGAHSSRVSIVLGSAWLDAAGSQVSLHLPSMTPQQIANSSWALAQLGWKPGPEWLRHWVAHMHSRLSPGDRASGHAAKQQASPPSHASLNSVHVPGMGLDAAQGPGHTSQQQQQQSAGTALSGQATSLVIAAASTWAVQTASPPTGIQQPTATPQLLALIDSACGSLAAEVCCSGCSKPAMAGGCACHPGKHSSQLLQSGIVPAESLQLEVLTALSALAHACSQGLQQQWQHVQQQTLQGQGGAHATASWPPAGVHHLARAAAAYAASPQGDAALSRGQFSTLCWSLARLGWRPSRSWVRAVLTPALAFLEPPVQRQSSRGHTDHSSSSSSSSEQQDWLDDREAGMLLYAARHWGVGAQAAARLMPQAGTPTLLQGHTLVELGPARIASLLATLAAERQSHRQPSLTREGPYVEALLTAAGHPSMASRLSPRDLSQVLESAVALGYDSSSTPPVAWLPPLVRRFSVLLRIGSGALSSGIAAEVPTCLWALSQLGIQLPPALLEAALTAALPPGATAAGNASTGAGSTGGGHHSLVDPQCPGHLCGLLDALAAWGVTPAPSWWEALLAPSPAWSAILHMAPPAAPGSLQAELGPGLLSNWQPQDLLHVLTRLVELKVVVPAPWLASARRAAMAHACAAAAAAGSANSNARATAKAGTRQVKQQSSRAGRLADRAVFLLAAAIQLQPVTGGQHSDAVAIGDQGASEQPTPSEDPEAPWLLGVALPCVEQIVLPRCTLAQGSVLLSALATKRWVLGPGAVDGLLTTHAILTRPLVEAAGRPRAVLSVLHALGELRARPDPAWAEAAAVRLGALLPVMTAAEVAACLPALVAARCNPGRRWLSLFLVAVAPAVSKRPAGAVMQPSGVHRQAVAGQQQHQQDVQHMGVTHAPGTGGDGSSSTSSGPATSSSSTASSGPSLGRPAPAATLWAPQRVAPGLVLTPGQVSALTSALMRLDPELGALWVASLGVSYG